MKHGTRWRTHPSFTSFDQGFSPKSHLNGGRGRSRSHSIQLVEEVSPQVWPSCLAQTAAFSHMFTICSYQLPDFLVPSGEADKEENICPKRPGITGTSLLRWSTTMPNTRMAWRALVRADRFLPTKPQLYMLQPFKRPMLLFKMGPCMVLVRTHVFPKVTTVGSMSGSTLKHLPPAVTT